MQQQLSDRKRAANRANAQKSTGPKSPQGKQAVRHNALNHGMYAVTTAVRLPIDDPHIFHALHCEWHRLYIPRDIEEHALLEAFVASHWRYIRQLNIENRIYTTELKSQDELRARGNKLQPDPSDPMACIAYAFRRLSSLDVCNRNIARLEKSGLDVRYKRYRCIFHVASELIMPSVSVMPSKSAPLWLHSHGLRYRSYCFEMIEE
jgi:hypothetical protein